jgi:hypothetical protein
MASNRNRSWSVEAAAVGEGSFSGTVEQFFFSLFSIVKQIKDSSKEYAILPAAARKPLNL